MVEHAAPGIRAAAVPDAVPLQVRSAPALRGLLSRFLGHSDNERGHLLLAGGMSVYMLIAIGYEERDLIAFHGRDYEDYRGRVGMLLPRLKSRG